MTNVSPAVGVGESSFIKDEELYEQSAKTVRKTRKTLREKNVPENYPSEHQSTVPDF